MFELSFAEENYLKAIYHLSADGKRQVNTNAIAERLETRPASVSDMIRKLSEKGVVTYVKYQGVNITEVGKKKALWVIRKHRLWEVFLVNKLNFHWDEVHDIAEQLEHIRSSLLISRLDEFLEFPKFDPHGDPIPNAEGIMSSNPMTILSELPIGKTAELVSMKDTGAVFLNYLDRTGLKIGSKINIVDKMEFDGSMEIMVDQDKTMSISKQVSDNLLVITE
ncbi:MAG: metal-dependent transcriptional regulator [Cyclobacteriaceae bacterium]|nr:metal-dependent transcriptional regulator [Cyclobacteriaceae bacterium]